MKTAKVLPLFKAGNKHLFTNYRSVSLLSQFFKISERLFNNRLEQFIEKHNLLLDSQYGFRANRSTALALADQIEEISNLTDNKKIVIGIFFDLKKAFDTIDHKKLLQKLDRYGIRGTALNWVGSYLENRRQFVRIGDRVRLSGDHKVRC